MVNVGWMLENSIETCGKSMKLMSKVILNWQHCVSTRFLISRVGAGKGNPFSSNACREKSCLILE